MATRQSRHLLIREPHQTSMLPDVAPSRPPTSMPSEDLASTTTPNTPSTGLDAPVSYTHESPTSFPVAPHHTHSRDPETSYSGNNSRFGSIPITPPRPSTQLNTRRLPSSAIGQSSLTPSRESSPSRLSTISALAGTPLSRVVPARHTRSHSTPMGFTGDRDRGQQQRGAAGLFSAIFSPPTKPNSPERSTPPTSILRTTTTPTTPSLLSSPSALTTTMGTPRSGSKGFFNFAFGNSNHINSPLSSRSSARAISPDHDTCLIDEFAGISFRSLLQPYTVEPQGTPETPEQALRRTPEGRLKELSSTAGDLLDRVYDAYKARTHALSDVLDEQEAQKEALEVSKVKTAEYKAQLELLATEERAAREEQQLRLSAYEKRIRELEGELVREKAKSQELEKRAVMENRRKRASTASDSGFESDADSLFSIREKDRGVSPVDSLLDGGVDDSSTAAVAIAAPPPLPLKCDSCSKSLYPISSSASSISSIRNPTPLSQAWGPDTTAAAAATQPSKWGFAAALRGNRQTGVWGGSDAEIIRQENRMLRARVDELESVVNDVLEVVAGRSGF